MARVSHPVLLATLIATIGPSLGDEPEAAGPSVMLLALDFSSNGALVVSGGDAVRVHATHTGELLRRLTPGKHTRTVAFSPTQKDLFVAAGDDSLIRMWRIANQQPFRTLDGHTGMVSHVAFSPNGKLLASAAIEYERGVQSVGQLGLWNVETGEKIRSLEFKGCGLRATAFSATGDRLAFAKNSRDNNIKSTVEIYDVEKWERLRSIPFEPGFAQSTFFAEEGRSIIVTGGHCVPLGPNSCRPTGKLWTARLDDDAPAKLWETKQCAYFRSGGLTPTGRRFATGTAIVRDRLNSRGNIVGRSQMAQIQMRQRGTGKVVWQTEGGVGEPYGVRVSPDGKLVGFCSDAKILMLDAKAGKLVRSIAVTN